jgi:DNA-binding response OmpR family regulator
MRDRDQALVILVIDEGGAASTTAEAVRAAGHHVLTATGIDTAMVVLGSLLPDLVLVRSGSPERNRQVAVRLRQGAPQVPVRFLDAATGLDTVLLDASDEAERTVN